MRFNLARRFSSQHQANIMKELVTSYAEEYCIETSKASAYISNGKQGLESFIEYIQKKFNLPAEIYSLPPNKTLFKNVGSDWEEQTRSTPSYGFVIDDNDPAFVALKFKHL